MNSKNTKTTIATAAESKCPSLGQESGRGHSSMALRAWRSLLRVISLCPSDREWRGGAYLVWGDGEKGEIEEREERAEENKRNGEKERDIKEGDRESKRGK